MHTQRGSNLRHLPVGSRRHGEVVPAQVDVSARLVRRLRHALPDAGLLPTMLVGPMSGDHRTVSRMLTPAHDDYHSRTRLDTTTCYCYANTTSAHSSGGAS